MEQKNTYNKKRVHKVNISVIACLVFMICGLVVISNGWAESLLPIVAGIVILGLSILNYFLPIPEFIKSLLFPLLPVVVIMGLFFAEGFSLNQHYILMVGITMIALFLIKSLLSPSVLSLLLYLLQPILQTL